MSMYRSSPKTVPTPVGTASDIEGELVLEGDIVLPNEQRTSRALAIHRTSRLWPNGVVPYTVEDGLKGNVRNAIKRWESRTNLRFIPRTDEVDYVAFERGPGCSSKVGRQGGRQRISVGPGCNVDATTHEIGHAIGLWHEQSRVDRDDHIEILRENIRPGTVHNFATHAGRIFGPYDYRSLMHYSARAFSINNQPTIRALDGRPVGGSGVLSDLDLQAVAQLYPEVSPEPTVPPDPQDPEPEPKPEPKPKPEPPTSRTELRLLEGRFVARATWEARDGKTGNALAHSLVDNDSVGLFWFFQPKNLELMVKMLPYPDGASWLGVCGSTDLGWTVEIVEVASGRSWTGSNPAGQVSAPLIESRAFPAP